MTTYWSAPLAPLDRPTGDRRIFTPGGLDTRPLPLPLLWQETTGREHWGSVVVGRILRTAVVGGEFVGYGDWLDQSIVPDVAKAMELARGGVVGLSVDLEPTFTAGVEQAPDGSPLIRYTRATIMGVTLVPMAAFSGMRVEVLDQMPGVLVAALEADPGLETAWAASQFAVAGDHWRGMPIAPRNQPFDADDAINRIVHWAGGDAGKMNQAFLWRNPSGIAGTKEAYRLPIADIINGKPTVVYHAAYAAAALLSGAHGGLPGIPDEEKHKLRAVLTNVYKALAEAYKDGNMLAPWDRRAKLQRVTSLEPETFAAGTTAGQVYNYLAENYPTDTLDWVKDAEWHDPVDVPLSDIAMERRPGGARDQKKVEGIADAISNGKKMEPVVLVRVPGEDKLQVADGYHRTLAFKRADKDSIKAWVGEVTTATGPWDKEMHEKKLNASLMAAGVLAPPKAWFERPEDGYTGPRVDAEGRVRMRLAKFGTCHVGIANACIQPPRSNVDYAYFRTGEVMTAEGECVQVGKITLGTGHARSDAGIIPAIEHYDHSGFGVAVVNVGEDDAGIWVAGAVVPGTPEEKVAELRRSPLSGDWRRVNGNLELVAALAVNTPGFPVVDMQRGRQQTLLAAGMIMEDGAEETVSELIADGAPAPLLDFDAMAREVRDRLRAEDNRAERLATIMASDQKDRSQRLAALKGQ